MTPPPLALQTYERPEPGLARGKWAAPAWAIGLLGAAVVVSAVGYLVWRARRARRADRADRAPDA